MKKTLVAALCALSLVAAGCGDDFDRDGAIDEMVEETGLDRSTATCIVDDIVDEFGEDRVTSDDQPTDEEQVKITEIMTACLSE